VKFRDRLLLGGREVVLLDRLIRGLMAGIAGGIVMNVLDFASYYIFQFSNLLLLDWASIVTYGHRPLNLTEYIFSLINQLGWAGFLGVIFAFVVPYRGSKYLLFKGAVYGFIACFFITAAPIFFQLPYLKELSTNTAISHRITSIIWGIVVAQTLYWLEGKRKEAAL